MLVLVWLRKLERLFIVTLFLSMVSLFFFNILIREFAGSIAGNFAWIEEAVRLLNLFLVFSVLGLALERGRHVSIDTLQMRLPSPVRLPLLRLIDLVGLVFALYLVSLGVKLIDFVLSTGQRSPTLDIPMGWVYLAPVIGFGLLGLRFALSFFGIIDRRANIDAATADATH